MKEEIKNLIQEGLYLLNKEPNHTLKPFHRQKIYIAFGFSQGVFQSKKFVLNHSFADKVVIWLSILSAQKVLPIWQQTFPENNLCQDLLTMATRAVQGKATFDEVKELFNNTFEEIESEASEGESNDKGYGNVVMTALEALRTTFRFTFWEETWIDENSVDYCDLDYDSEDTAFWAASAFSQATSDKNFSPQKSYEFWQWWLTEAIPQAWELASNS